MKSFWECVVDTNVHVTIIILLLMCFCFVNCQRAMNYSHETSMAEQGYEQQIHKETGELYWVKVTDSVEKSE